MLECFQQDTQYSHAAVPMDSLWAVVRKFEAWSCAMCAQRGSQSPQSVFLYPAHSPLLLMAHFAVTKLEAQRLQERSILALGKHVVRPWTRQLRRSVATVPLVLRRGRFWGVPLGGRTEALGHMLLCCWFLPAGSCSLQKL